MLQKMVDVTQVSNDCSFPRGDRTKLHLIYLIIHW